MIIDLPIAFMMKKASFFSRLTGKEADGYDDEEYFGNAVPGTTAYNNESRERGPRIAKSEDHWDATHEEPQGELSVDVYQTPDNIVVKAFLAGVQPGSIDISLTREMLTISGTREDDHEAEDDSYYSRELYWGSFSRTIQRPR